MDLLRKSAADRASQQRKNERKAGREENELKAKAAADLFEKNESARGSWYGLEVKISDPKRIEHMPAPGARGEVVAAIKTIAKTAKAADHVGSIRTALAKAKRNRKTIKARSAPQSDIEVAWDCEEILIIVCAALDKSENVEKQVESLELVAPFPANRVVECRELVYPRARRSPKLPNDGVHKAHRVNKKTLFPKGPLDQEDIVLAALELEKRLRTGVSRISIVRDCCNDDEDRAQKLNGRIRAKEALGEIVLQKPKKRTKRTKRT